MVGVSTFDDEMDNYPLWGEAYDAGRGSGPAQAGSSSSNNDNSGQQPTSTMTTTKNQSSFGFNNQKNKILFNGGSGNGTRQAIIGDASGAGGGGRTGGKGKGGQEKGKAQGNGGSGGKVKGQPRPRSTSSKTPQAPPTITTSTKPPPQANNPQTSSSIQRLPIPEIPSNPNHRLPLPLPLPIALPQALVPAMSGQQISVPPAKGIFRNTIIAQVGWKGNVGVQQMDVGGSGRGAAGVAFGEGGVQMGVVGQYGSTTSLPSAQLNLQPRSQSQAQAQTISNPSTQLHPDQVITNPQAHQQPQTLLENGAAGMVRGMSNPDRENEVDGDKMDTASNGDYSAGNGHPSDDGDINMEEPVSISTTKPSSNSDLTLGDGQPTSSNSTSELTNQQLDDLYAQGGKFAMQMAQQAQEEFGAEAESRLQGQAQGEEYDLNPVSPEQGASSSSRSPSQFSRARKPLNNKKNNQSHPYSHSHSTTVTSKYARHGRGSGHGDGVSGFAPKKKACPASMTLKKDRKPMIPVAQEKDLQDELMLAAYGEEAGETGQVGVLEEEGNSSTSVISQTMEAMEVDLEFEDRAVRAVIEDYQDQGGFGPASVMQADDPTPSPMDDPFIAGDQGQDRQQQQRDQPPQRSNQHRQQPVLFSNQPSRQDLNQPLNLTTPRAIGKRSGQAQAIITPSPYQTRSSQAGSSPFPEVFGSQERRQLQRSRELLHEEERILYRKLVSDKALTKSDLPGQQDMLAGMHLIVRAEARERAVREAKQVSKQSILRVQHIEKELGAAQTALASQNATIDHYRKERRDEKKEKSSHYQRLQHDNKALCQRVKELQRIGTDYQRRVEGKVEMAQRTFSKLLVQQKAMLPSSTLLTQLEKKQLIIVELEKEKATGKSVPALLWEETVKTLRKECAKYANEIETKREQLEAALKKQEAEIEKAVVAGDSKVSLAQQELQTLRQEQSELDKKAKEANDTLHREISSHMQQIGALDKELSMVKDQLQQSTTAIKQRDQRVSELDKTLTSVRSKLDEQEQLTKTTNTALVDAREKVAERDTALIGLQGIEKAMGHAKTKIQDQEETIKRQRDDIKEIEANKAKQAEEIEKLNSSITDVQKELSTAKYERERLQGENDAMKANNISSQIDKVSQAASTHFDSLKAHLTKMQEAFSVRQSATEHETAKAQLEHKIQVLEDKLRELDAKLDTEITNGKTISAQHSATTKALAAATQEKAAVVKQHQEKLVECGEMQERVKRAKEATAELERERGMIMERYDQGELLAGETRLVEAVEQARAKIHAAELKSVQDPYDKLREEYDSLKTRSDQAEADYNTKAQQADQSYAKLEGEKKDLEGRLQKIESTLKDREKEFKELKQQLATAHSQLKHNTPKNGRTLTDGEWTDSSPRDHQERISSMNEDDNTNQDQDQDNDDIEDDTQVDPFTSQARTAPAAGSRQLARNAQQDDDEDTPAVQGGYHGKKVQFADPKAFVTPTPANRAATTRPAGILSHKTSVQQTTTTRRTTQTASNATEERQQTTRSTQRVYSTQDPPPASQQQRGRFARINAGIPVSPNGEDDDDMNTQQHQDNEEAQDDIEDEDEDTQPGRRNESEDERAVEQHLRRGPGSGSGSGSGSSSGGQSSSTARANTQAQAQAQAQAQTQARSLTQQQIEALASQSRATQAKRKAASGVSSLSALNSGRSGSVAAGTRGASKQPNAMNNASAPASAQPGRYNSQETWGPRPITKKTKTS